MFGLDFGSEELKGYGPGEIIDGDFFIFMKKMRTVSYVTQKFKLIQQNSTENCLKDKEFFVFTRVSNLFKHFC